MRHFHPPPIATTTTSAAAQNIPLFSVRVQRIALRGTKPSPLSSPSLSVRCCCFQNGSNSGPHPSPLLLPLLLCCLCCLVQCPLPLFSDWSVVALVTCTQNTPTAQKRTFPIPFYDKNEKKYSFFMFPRSGKICTCLDKCNVCRATARGPFPISTAFLPFFRRSDSANFYDSPARDGETETSDTLEQEYLARYCALCLAHLGTQKCICHLFRLLKQDFLLLVIFQKQKKDCNNLACVCGKGA